MKILFVTQWYPTRKQPFFGIFVREHARAVQAAGHQVQVAAVHLKKGSGLLKIKTKHYTDEAGIEVFHREISSIFKDLLYHLPDLQFFFLKKLVSQLTKPDLVHSHVIYPAGIWGASMATQWGVPHVITEHWSRLKDFRKSIYFQRGKRAYLSAARILPVSAFLKSSVRSLLPELPEQRFTVIGNVVDSKIFFYRKEQKDASVIRLCAVATWQHKKKADKMPELFIDSLAVLQKKTERKMVLTLIGGGNRVPDLQEHCYRVGLTAQFPGFIPKEDLAEELHKTDIFVHASAIETFSIVVAEALACGVPVVCSQTGALPELVRENNGILCENTVADWTYALEKALSTDFDRPAIAEALSERFSKNSIGRKISEVYSSVLNGN